MANEETKKRAREAAIAYSVQFPSNRRLVTQEAFLAGAAFAEAELRHSSSPPETQGCEPTVEESLRFIHKLEKCTSDGVKLILLKNLMLRALPAAPEKEQ